MAELAVGAAGAHRLLAGRACLPCRRPAERAHLARSRIRVHAPRPLAVQKERCAPQVETTGQDLQDLGPRPGERVIRRQGPRHLQQYV